MISYSAVMKNFQGGQNLTLWEEDGRVEHSAEPVKAVVDDLIFRMLVYIGSSLEYLERDRGKDISREGCNRVVLVVDQHLCLYITYTVDPA